MFPLGYSRDALFAIRSSGECEVSNRQRKRDKRDSHSQISLIFTIAAAGNPFGLFKHDEVRRPT